MNGKEIVKLIYGLKQKGMSSDEIIELILFIEGTEPHAYSENENSGESGDADADKE